MPYHIWARPGDISPAVIGVGDPARAKLYASIMEDVRLVNENRFLVYTGRVLGRWVTVAAHGIGGPSIAITLEELRSLGMETFIRIGTAGSLGGLQVGDVVVAAGAAATPGGLYNAYFHSHCPPLSADPMLTVRLAQSLKAPVGYVVSSDAFYGEGPHFVEFWRSRGALAVEMECAAAMALGWLKGFKTGCVLVISNVVGKHEVVDLRQRFLEVFLKVVETL
ncbi:MAG: nucleoside phosphorylase [Pyrobaculum sp.]